jgi:methylamine dehydrogenase accessory protein MauD
MSTAAWITIGVLWAVVIAVSLVVLALARQIGVLHERLQPVGALTLAKGLKVGDKAPEFELTTLAGVALHVGGGGPLGGDSLVMFVSPTCPVCKSLLPALRSIRRSERPRIDVILASDGLEAEHRSFIATESLQEFPYVLSEKLGIAYGASRLPHAVLLDGSGTVRATGLVNSREHLDSLFEARERGVASLQEFLERAERRNVA